MTIREKLGIWLVVSCIILGGCNGVKEADSSNNTDTTQAKEPIVIEMQTDDEMDKVVEEKKEYEFVEAEYTEGDLYSDPCLMNPTENSVEVVWFTEGESSENYALVYEVLGDERATRRVEATTTKMSLLRGGNTDSDKDDPSIKREIYRHMALIDDLPVNDGNEETRVPYRVVTDGIASEKYSLSAMAGAGVGQRILFTSDLQLKEMSAANMQKVVETVGRVDAVFANGDLADVPDRAYDWFDSDNAFFKVMQGRASHKTNGVVYEGGAILQNAPIFPAIGNHDVMGVYSETNPLSYQFNNPTINDFNTTTWEELFSNPESESGTERYYAFTIGDARVVVLEMARIWRLSQVGILGKYSELPGTSESEYGSGQFIFESIKEGSPQLEFLKKELSSDEFQNAKYKIVMYHFDSHSLGGNTIPPYTDPVKKVVKDIPTGLDMIFYDYPISEDYIAKYVDPLMEQYNVNLVLTGHSHLWNRFKMGKVNILQSSNGANTYNAFYGDSGERELAPSAFSPNDLYYQYRDNWDKNNYVMKGDPGGLEPISPTVASLPNDEPYLASNTITAFSILDTGSGVVESYYFDTEKPDSEVVLFDSFNIE